MKRARHGDTTIASGANHKDDDDDGDDDEEKQRLTKRQRRRAELPWSRSRAMHSVPNVCLGHRKADPLLRSDNAAVPVPLDVFTPWGVWCFTRPTSSSPGSITVVAVMERLEKLYTLWNMLLSRGVRGMIMDRALFTSPGSFVAAQTESVPLLVLRNFLFERPLAPGAYEVPELTAEARTQLATANPLQRERSLQTGFQTSDWASIALSIDLALAPFEVCVARLLHDRACLFLRHVAPVVRHVCHPRRDERPDYWRGVPLPATACEEPQDDAAHYGAHLIASRLVLWAIVVWRLTCSYALEQALDLRPMDDSDGSENETPRAHRDERLAYNFLLQRDTHLDLLTLVAHTRRFSDEALVMAMLSQPPQGRNGESSPLTGAYPYALRVLCSGELANVADVLPMANIWYDTGVKRTRETVLQAVTHIFACKMMNQKCVMRDLDSLVFNYATDFPGFNRLFKLHLHCSLLGNMPRARCRPLMAARLRIHAAFLLEPGGPSTPLRRSTLGTWLKGAIYTALFVLRELFIVTVESVDGVLDDMLMPSYRWCHYKRIVRACNGEIRRVLSHQASHMPPNSRFDWAQLHRVASNRNGKPKKCGIVNRYHDMGLRANTKLRKGRWEEIILKKIASCYTDKKYTALRKLCSEEETCAALVERIEAIEEALHLCAWRAAEARATSEVLETRWLQVLGMSAEGLADIRRWQYEYYTYDVSDHSYVDKIFHLFRRNMFDGALLKVYILLVEHYASEALVLLPGERGLKQARALRQRFAIDAWQDTPPLLGKCYLCNTCHQWANPVVEPPVALAAASIGDAATGSGGGAGSNLAASTLLVDCVKREDEKKRHHDDDDNDNDNDDNTEGDGGANDDNDLDQAMQQEKRQLYNQKRLTRRAQQSLYMSSAWYDPLEHRLCCRRRHTVVTVGDTGAVIPEASAAADADDDGMDILPLEEEEDDVAEDGSGGGGGGGSNGEGKKRDAAETYLTNYFSQRHRSRGAYLKRVDMIGAWMRTRHGIFGLCDECGVMTQIANSRMSNRGVSCRRHITTDLAETSPVRVMLETQVQRRLAVMASRTAAADALAAASAAAAATAVTATTDTGPPAVRLCALCRDAKATRQLTCYETTTYAVKTVPLCDAHSRDLTQILHRRSIYSTRNLATALVRFEESISTASTTRRMFSIV